MLCVSNGTNCILSVVNPGVNPGVDEIPTLYNSITSTMIMSPISQLLIIFFGLIETYIKYDNFCVIKNKYTMYQVQD